MNFNPESLAVLIPVVALMIPIVKILTSHQQKMAELIHGKQQEQAQIAPLMHEIQSMRAELQHLRESQNVQQIEMDDLKGLRSGALSNPPSVPNEVTSEA